MSRLIQKYNSNIDENSVSNIATQLDLPFLLVKLLFCRGIDNILAIQEYLGLKHKQSYDPFLLYNMQLLCDRIYLARDLEQKVVVFGDYDCDGVCSTAMLTNYLNSIGMSIVAHLPSRYEHGYGLKIESLIEIIQKHSPQLVVTCDCGISNIKEVKWLNEQGIDIIVTDHHQPPSVLPDCIVVNPKIPNCEYPDKYLCGAGIVLKIIMALGGNPMDYIDLACVATIGDIVPLLDENRLIVKRGLHALNNLHHNKGLKLLIQHLQITNINESDIAFKIVPRINVLGRLGEANLALQLLTSDDTTQLNKIIQDIEAYNDTRKLLCQQQYNQALSMLDNGGLFDNFILLISDEWKKGLTGILSSQLSNQFLRPSFVLAYDKDNIYKATCRSISSINIVELLESAKDMLLEYGGHSQAAGFAIHKDNIKKFEEHIRQKLSTVDIDMVDNKCEYDLQLQVSDINTQFVSKLQLMSPFGIGNPEPVFRIDANTVQSSTIKTIHTKLDIQGLKVLKFFDKNPLQILGEHSKSFVVNLRISSFGKNSVEGFLNSVHSQTIYTDDLVSNTVFVLNHCLKGDSIPKYTQIELFDIIKLVKNKFGTLVVCSNRYNYNIIKGLPIPNIVESDFVYIDTNNFSKIVLSPILQHMSLGCFDTIIFDNIPYNLKMISYINTVSNAKVFVCNLNTPLPQFDLSRTVLGDVYNAVVSLKKEHEQLDNKLVPIARDLLHLSQIAYTKYQISPIQFVFGFSVFSELGIVNTIQSQPLQYSVANQKTNLNSSTIYQDFVDICNNNIQKD
ncbi:MAG: single-stranded-DNA-specific exonuclease RecJ [Firmicutes bacterium]|nr:single-stranded-DNA-specific exonuclease RecJ [Bacillota bacterium]